MPNPVEPGADSPLSPALLTHFSESALAQGRNYLIMDGAVSYTHLRAHETVLDLVCRLLLEKKNKKNKKKNKKKKKQNKHTKKTKTRIRETTHKK